MYLAVACDVPRDMDCRMVPLAIFNNQSETYNNTARSLRTVRKLDLPVGQLYQER